jgi:hypothetical protein
MLNNDIKSSPKPLWSFIKSKRCDSTGVAPLSKGGNNHSGSLENANILNDQFTSVFPEENTTNEMHLPRLLALGPGVVRPGQLKLELVLTLGVTLLENDLICCLVLLP